MQISFSELRAKEVVNTADGSKLGRVCDLTFSYPDNKVLGILVPDGKGLCSKKMFVEMKCIVKIGDDVVLVDVGEPQKRGCDKPKEDKEKKRPQICGGSCGRFGGEQERRSFEEYE